MTDPLIRVAMKYCLTHLSSLDRDFLVLLQQELSAVQPSLSSVSIDVFEKLYQQKAYQDIEDFDVLRLPLSLKKKLLSLCKQYSSGNVAQQHSTMSVPELPQEKNPVKQTPVEQESPLHDDWFNSIAVKSRAIQQRVHSMNESEQVESELPGFETSDTSTVAVLQKQQTPAVAPQTLAQVSFQQGLSSVDPVLVEKQDQLQDVRMQLQQARKELHAIKTAITYQISSIDDPKIADVIDFIKKRTQDLESREQLIVDQRKDTDEFVQDAQQRVLELKEKEQHLHDTLLSLRKDKQQLENTIAKIKTKKAEKEAEIDTTNQKYVRLVRQVEETQHLYDELNTHVQSISDQIDLSKEELHDYQQELDDREKTLEEKERDLQIRYKHERQHMSERIRELEQQYRKKHKSLQRRESALESQKMEIQTMKQELNGVREDMQKERVELDERESELSERFLAVERAERDLHDRQKSLNQTAQESLEYIEQRKSELHRDALLQESKFDQKLIDLQRKEMDLLKKQQLLLNEQSQHSRSDTKKSIRDQQDQINKYSDEIDRRIAQLEHYERVADKTSDVYTSVPDIQPLDTPAKPFHGESSEKGSFRERIEHSAGIPSADDIQDIPDPGSEQHHDKVDADEELRLLLDLAKDEVYHDNDLAKVTYAQIKELFDKANKDIQRKYHNQILQLYKLIEKRK